LAWPASARTSCASRLVIALARQSSHPTPLVGWVKAPLAFQTQHRPLSLSSRALLPASSARSLGAQASEPLLLLPVGGRDRPLHLTWWRGRGSPSPTVPGGRSRSKAMDEAGRSHLPFSPLVSRGGGFFSGTPFPAVLAGRGGVGFPVTLHRSCPRLCACPVLAAGDSLSAGVWSKLWDKKRKENSPPDLEILEQSRAAGGLRSVHGPRLASASPDLSWVAGLMWPGGTGTAPIIGWRCCGACLWRLKHSLYSLLCTTLTTF
jgi:hypothetical protein